MADDCLREVIRGTPLLIQLFIVLRIAFDRHQVLATFGRGHRPQYQLCGPEAGIRRNQSIPGQLDAALALGLTRIQTFGRLSAPSRCVVIPPVTNDFIALLGFALFRLSRW
jgi:ABC-type amino acid transport system permease subunit